MRLFTNKGQTDEAAKLSQEIELVVVQELISFRKEHPDADYRDMITIAHQASTAAGLDVVLNKLWWDKP